MLFNMKPDFPTLNNLTKFFEPYYELWTKIRAMMEAKTKWAECPMRDIDTDAVDLMMKDSQKTLQKL